ncbi:MAG TPA: hypothetical protein VFV60_01750 [bacterium]|nr:hypothetical protein [bacterium]
MYTRVFQSILDSSLNCSHVPISARWLWLVMLLLADEDRTGIVDMPVERLAAQANLSLEDTRTALAVLMAPDPTSRSDEAEGRRLLPIRDSERGWELVNYSKYREIADAENRRASNRARVAEFRAKKKRNASVRDGNSGVVTGNGDETNGHAPNQTHTKPDSYPPTPQKGNGSTGVPPKPSPTLEDVQAECSRHGYHVDPQTFFDEFQSYSGSHSWQSLLRGYNALRKS